MNVCFLMIGVAVVVICSGVPGFSQEVLPWFDAAELPVAVSAPISQGAREILATPETFDFYESEWLVLTGRTENSLPADVPVALPELQVDPYAALKPCPWWRPCGPANSFGRNWLFYQGAYGADFRSACQGHDDCLMNPYHSRYGCDRAFYANMVAACAHSMHPAACRSQATLYYVGVRLFGGMVRAGAP